MATSLALIFDLIAKDQASPAFLRVAGAADKAATATERSMKSIEGASARMSAVGAKMTKGITLPLLGIGAVAVDQAAKFQKSMTLIQTAGGETAAKTAVISAGIKKVAVDTGTSLSQLSDGIYTVAKAGGQKWTAAEQLNVLKAAAQGAKAENVDLGTSVNALTSVMMSYHIPASDAVKVQNEMIVGAGKAKTTMQEYAASLATVIPVASAAGVKFDQVAGAIATLTQHGTSAQEATQELAFTIRNLQAPNNVAVSAMNQLGISSVNVAKNLGQRGLTGTLAYIESKLPKTGLVYLDTMKQMEAGTSDLTAMQAKMSPQLKTLSKGFLDGSVSAKEYRTSFRDLGATGYAQGTAFLSLAAKVKGYNDNVKAGTPAQKTMAAELKAIFGGATGLNTALQLGGANMKYFTTATDAVAAAANKAGVNVLGWGKTQGTLAVQMDKAKENLQVLAVEIGTALIPAVTKIASAMSGAVHWFSGLSSTQKQVVGWSVGVLAAIGPVLAIGGKLATVGRGLGLATAGIGRAFTFIGTGATTMSANVTRAVSGMTAALVGAGIGVAIGSLTKNSGTATKAVGALGSTVAGAAIGFGAGGPLGAAIGGAAGLIGNLAVSYFNAGNSASKAGTLAKEALDAQKSAATSLLGTLQSVNGAYNAQYKQQVIQQLGSKGLLSAADKLNIDPRSVVSAALGSNADTTKLLNTISSAGATGKISDAQAQKLIADFAGISKGAAAAEYQYELQRKAAEGLAAASTPLNNSLRGLQKEFASTGVNVRQLASEYGKNGEAQTAIGLKTTAIIRDHIKAVGDDANAQLAQHKSVQSVASAYESQVGSLRANLTQLGFNSAAVSGMIVKYGKIPKSVATELIKRGVLPADIQAIISKYNLIPKSKSTTVAVTDHASSSLIAIKNHLDSIQGKTIVINTAYKVTGGGLNVQGGAGVQARAAGGYIAGPGSGTSDSIPARLSNGEFVVKASQTAKHLSLLHAINAGAKGFAAGGVAGSVASLSSSTLTNQLIAAVHQLRTSLTAALSSVATSMRTTLASAQHTVGTTVRAAVAPAVTDQNVLAAGLGGSISTAVAKQQQALIAAANYAKLAAEAAKLTAAEKASAAASHAHAQELSNAAHAATVAAENMHGTSKAAQAAKDAAEAHARALGTEARAATQAASASSAASKSRTAALKGEAAIATAVAAKAKAAASAAKQAAQDAAQAAADQAKSLVDSIQSSVDTMKSTITDFKTSLAQSITGDDSLSSLWGQLTGTDGGSTASLATLQTSLDQALTAAQTFASNLTQLVGEGANQDLITQLTGMGATAGGALAQQLIAAGPAAVGALQTTMDQIQSVAGSAAQSIATSFYGPGVTAMNNFIAGVEKQYPSLKAALDPIATMLAALVNQATQVATAAAGGKPAAKAAKVPSFASGVTNFGTGVALVHAGEALVNFRYPGNDVLTAKQTANAMKYPASHASRQRAPLGNTSGLEKRLDLMLRRMESTERTIAATPEQTGQHVADASVNGYRVAGAADRRQALRAGRRAAR